MKEIPVGSPLTQEQGEVLTRFTQILPLLHDPSLSPTQHQEVEIEHSKIYHEAYELGMIGIIVAEHAKTTEKPKGLLTNPK